MKETKARLRTGNRLNIKGDTSKLTFIYELDHNSVPRVGETIKIQNSHFESWYDKHFSHLNNNETFFHFCDIFGNDDEYFGYTSEEYIVDKVTYDEFGVNVDISPTDEVLSKWDIDKATEVFLDIHNNKFMKKMDKKKKEREEDKKKKESRRKWWKRIFSSAKN